MVCIKPCGVLSTDEPGGMPDLLRKELGGENEEVHTVHRLDRVVGGLMVFARTQASAAALSRQIAERTFQKEYLAVAHGCPEPPEGKMEDLLFRNAAENKTYVVKRMRKGVREAALEYRTLKTVDGCSLVRIRLLTGRTHQIRAQFSSRAMPLFGDRKYGAAGDNGEIALWSCALTFRHPRTLQEMHFEKEPSGGIPWSGFGYEGEGVPSVREMPVSSADRPGRERTFTCPQFGRCGGCQMLSLPYSQQLAEKQERMQKLLRRFGSVDPILGMDQPVHYRNKVHAVFGTDAGRNVISGNYKASSHQIIPVESCLLNDELADAIIADVRALVKRFHIAPYDELKKTGFLRHVLIRRGFSTGQVMVVLVVSSPVFKLQKPFLKALLEKHPEITTVILNVNDAFTPVILGRQEKTIYGPGSIEDVLCGCRFRISAKSFYQVNPVQTEKLYETALSFAALSGKEAVLDAYCGTGTIGITAARHCLSVTGVEINRDAVQDAVLNAKRNHAGNIRFVCADAGEYMVEAAAKKQHFDVVFMDPPRAGSDEHFLTALLHLGPEKIIYISCGPETLARDLEILTSGGYTVKKIQPIDMFPHTDHVETVVCLSNKNARPKDFVEIGVDAEDYYRIKDSEKESK